MFGRTQKRTAQQYNGSDAKLGSSAFIDIKNGCVFTSHSALELATQKDADDLKKHGIKEAGRVERELKQTERMSKHLGEASTFRNHRKAISAALCGENVSDFRNLIRILNDRFLW